VPQPAPFPAAAPGGPEVAVLMALHDGAPWLAPQLDSIAAQTGVRWRLHVGDDGSADNGPALVEDFGARYGQGRVRLHPGPRRGAAMNFLSLLPHAGRTVPYAAFADQDDVWLAEKLSRAVARLEALPPDVPALCCGRTIVTDAALRPLGLSPPLRRPPSFRNALVQNVAAGNTVVMNRAALDLAQAAAAEAGAVVMHDWWLYQIVTGAGGTVVFDDKPSVLYRQHGGNLVGANGGWRARARRAALVATGRLGHWNDINVAALPASRHHLTAENRRILSEFAAARSASLPRRLARLGALGLYRQTPGGSATWWAAAAAGLV
jgi:glycosyltransferase involved in cell wall biosynthesis